MLFIKSTRGLFPRIRKEISKIHGYQTPEIICLPIVEGSEDYLKWVEESVVKATESI